MNYEKNLAQKLNIKVNIKITLITAEIIYGSVSISKNTRITDYAKTKWKNDPIITLTDVVIDNLTNERHSELLMIPLNNIAYIEVVDAEDEKSN